MYHMICSSYMPIHLINILIRNVPDSINTFNVIPCLVGPVGWPIIRALMNLPCGVWHILNELAQVASFRKPQYLKWSDTHRNMLVHSNFCRMIYKCPGCLHRYLNVTSEMESAHQYNILHTDFNKNNHLGKRSLIKTAMNPALSTSIANIFHANKFLFRLHPLNNSFRLSNPIATYIIQLRTHIFLSISPNDWLCSCIVLSNRIYKHLCLRIIAQQFIITYKWRQWCEYVTIDNPG